MYLFRWLGRSSDIPHRIHRCAPARLRPSHLYGCLSIDDMLHLCDSAPVSLTSVLCLKTHMSSCMPCAGLPGCLYAYRLLLLLLSLLLLLLLFLLVLLSLLLLLLVVVVVRLLLSLLLYMLACMSACMSVRAPARLRARPTVHQSACFCTSARECT